MTLSVIGAGLGRTGTLSLRTALERLGPGPCYHMREVLQRPEHVEIWDRAADGKQVDWEVLPGSYRSAVDWPVCAFYRELAKRYPQAKVILTKRDPERWHSSVMETIYPFMAKAVLEGDPALQAWGPWPTSSSWSRRSGDDWRIASTPLLSTSGTTRRCDGPFRRRGYSFTRLRRAGSRYVGFWTCPCRRSLSRRSTRRQSIGSGLWLGLEVTRSHRTVRESRGEHADPVWAACFESTP